MEWVKRTVLKMAADIMANDDNLEDIIKNLDNKTNEININIRAPENRYVIHCISVLMLNLAEQKYGETSVGPDDIYMSPEFLDIPRSYVGRTQKTETMLQEKHIICLGTLVTTWEQLFYELAHETVHLLGPTDTNKNTVARIEEGVAVKFAEDFYKDFVYPSIKRYTYSSPLSTPLSVYYKAYKATSKIPDDILKSIRSNFTNFKDVKKEGLYEISKSFISEEEAGYLSLPFDYKAP